MYQAGIIKIPKKKSPEKSTQQLISQSPQEMEVLTGRLSPQLWIAIEKTTDTPAILFQMEKFLE